MNFQCDGEGETVGFHFNPRQDEEDVVLNARLGGDWGEEQRGFENDFAFKRGQFFDAFFIATEGRFNVRAWVAWSCVFCVVCVCAGVGGCGCVMGWVGWVGKSGRV